MIEIVAHQGGWDEVLWFGTPVVLVVLWVRWAERRARERLGAEADEGSSTMPDMDGGDRS